MSSVQRIIKYLALALSFLLTFSIISIIVYGALMISNIFNREDVDTSGDVRLLGEFEKVSILNIDIDSSNIEIKIGDGFRVETSNKYIELREDNKEIYVTEKKHNWFTSKNVSNLVIYVPHDVLLERVDINSGAGTVDMEELLTEKLNFDLGAGTVNINNLNVLNTAKIDGGVGEININNSSLNNLKLNIGVGKFTMKARISGNSEIDHGIGEASLNLMGEKNNYQIHVDKGIGSLTIDGNEAKDDYAYGNGIDRIDINGGMGRISINFME